MPRAWRLTSSGGLRCGFDAPRYPNTSPARLDGYRQPESSHCAAPAMWPIVRRPMREKLIEILREPGTGSPLTLKNPSVKGGEIEEGQLVSATTGRSYA